MTTTVLDPNTLTDITAEVLKRMQGVIERRVDANHGEYLVCTVANLLAVLLRAQDPVFAVAAFNATLEESELPYRLRSID